MYNARHVRKKCKDHVSPDELSSLENVPDIDMTRDFSTLVTVGDA